MRIMWKDVLGVDVNFVTQERQVYLVTRQDGKEQIYRNSWVQDYPDANNFLFDVFGLNAAFTAVVDWPANATGDVDAEYTTGDNPNFDKFNDLLTQAANEQDPQKRMLFDEKIGGTIHFAVGAGFPECGGRNESGLHWDMLCDMADSEITLDGDLFYKNGKTVVE